MRKLALTLLILVVAASAIVAVQRMARRRPASAVAPIPAEAGPTRTAQKPNIHQVNRHLEYLKRAGQSPAAPAFRPETPPASLQVPITGR